MPSNMENQQMIPEPVPGEDLLEREERCQKAIRTVTKAIIMRLFVCGLMIWVLFQTSMEVWLVGLIGLVLLINGAGVLPLAAELKKRRQEWKDLLAEEE